MTHVQLTLAEYTQRSVRAAMLLGYSGQEDVLIRGFGTVERVPEGITAFFLCELEGKFPEVLIRSF